MQIDNPVREDIYQLDLWAGGQLLWNSSFKPSEHGEWGGAGGGAQVRLRAPAAGKDSLRRAPGFGPSSQEAPQPQSSAPPGWVT